MDTERPNGIFIDLSNISDEVRARYAEGMRHSNWDRYWTRYVINNDGIIEKKSDHEKKMEANWTKEGF